jgi:reactive intermediate/imine deaminase
MRSITTPEAPAAIGTYSQAVRAGDFVFLSGQIPLDPKSMQLVAGPFEEQVKRVFENLRAVCREAGGDFDRVARVTVYLTDLADFAKVNEVMASYFNEPYPARAAVGVASLPRGCQVEIDAIMYLGSREEALAPSAAAEVALPPPAA